MSDADVRLKALCDHALVGQDGKVSLVGIFRNISVSALPAQHPRMFVVAVLGLEAGTHQVLVRLQGPDGEGSLSAPPELTVRSAGSAQDVNVIVELNNLSFTAYGEHRFELEVDGRTVGDLPVAIVHMPSPAQGRRTN